MSSSALQGWPIQIKSIIRIYCKISGSHVICFFGEVLSYFFTVRSHQGRIFDCMWCRPSGVSRNCCISFATMLIYWILTWMCSSVHCSKCEPAIAIFSSYSPRVRGAFLLSSCLSATRMHSYFYIVLHHLLLTEGGIRTTGHLTVTWLKQQDGKKMEKQLKAAAQYLSPEQAVFTASISMILLIN